MRAQVDLADELSHHLDAPDWNATTAVVDGMPTSFRSRRLGDVWAAVADLEGVAVGICGCGLELGDYALEPVNDLTVYPRL
ncbi:MAG: hypothetical protein ACRDQA_22160 [Nocardioidaceae bacterium]